MINNEDKPFEMSRMSEKYCNAIMSEFISGNAETFFDIWNASFPFYFKQSTDYSVMTLKLRVHYAILPMRIVQLHRYIDCVLNCSNRVSEILENAAGLCLFINDEKESNDEERKVIINSMKQLEYYLNSNDGQKFIMELKDSSFKTFFTLPYIVDPQYDESINKIFSIDWLERLTLELEQFINRFVRNEIPLREQTAINIPHEFSSNMKHVQETPVMKTPPLVNPLSNSTNNCTNKADEADNEFIYKNQIIHLISKNKEIENWIENQSNKIEDNNLCTKSTQTNITTVKTGDALIIEPCLLPNTVNSNITTDNKHSLHISDELSVTKSQLLNLHKHYQKLKLRFHKLHDDYLKMNEVAEILTISLENSIRGQPIPLDTILQSCFKIIPDRFNRYVGTDSENSSIRIKEDFSKNVLNNNEKQNILNQIQVPPKLLDYKKIKLHLKYGGIDLKVLLLQALRKKITLSLPEERDDIIYEYTAKDLLGLKENVLNTSNCSTLFHLLQPINFRNNINVMHETLSRFLNALASITCGRNYLSSSPVAISTIIMYLNNCSNSLSDAITIDMLLATLQKMSLRKVQRSCMIEGNLVEWLIYHLSTENLKMRPYRLEYACALLMNLSLQSSARSRASAIASLLVQTMMSLLSTDCALILPYINGALQNFLLNNEINEAAKKLNLTEILQCCCTETDEESRRHIVHTLKIHERECDESLSDSDDFLDEDDDIFNLLEKEIDEDDPLVVSVGELQGENLLETCYSISSFLLQSNEVDTKKTVNTAMPLTDNLQSIENDKIDINVSKIINTSETKLSDLKTETIEKKNNIAAVDPSNEPLSITKNELKFHTKKEEEEVFSAKPKIMRTPPASGPKKLMERVF